MDKVKGKVDEIVAKIKADPKLGEKFTKEPVKTVEGLLGVDLPDDAVNSVVEGVKAKLAGKDLKDSVSGLLGGLKGKQ